jgi:hypothetical protein
VCRRGNPATGRSVSLGLPGLDRAFEESALLVSFVCDRACDRERRNRQPTSYRLKGAATKTNTKSRGDGRARIGRTPAIMRLEIHMRLKTAPYLALLGGLLIGPAAGPGLPQKTAPDPSPLASMYGYRPIKPDLDQRRQTVRSVKNAIGTNY